MIAKKLTKVGNTQAVILDKTLLSLVDADTESTFKISIDGKKIVLEAMTQKEVDRMALEASDKIRKVQKSVFKKLASGAFLNFIGRRTRDSSASAERIWWR